jgi:hypothetical protein
MFLPNFNFFCSLRRNVKITVESKEKVDKSTFL